MASKSVELRNAVVEALNEQPDDFVFQFEAESAAAPLSAAALESLTELKVLVFTGAMKSERVTRGRFKKTYKPVVAIHRRLTQESVEGDLVLADSLVELKEQIAARMEGVDFILDDGTNLSFVGFDEEQDVEHYNAEAMLIANLFLHAMALEYTTG